MCITLITSVKPPCPRRVAYSQVLGSRKRTLLGGHYSTYHMLCGPCSWLPFLNSDAATCSGSGGTWQVCSTPTGIWVLGSSLWTKFSIWTVPCCRQWVGTREHCSENGQNPGTGLGPSLSFSPWHPWCLIAPESLPFMLCWQSGNFFLLAPVLLTGSHWPGTSSSSFSFPSLCLTWSTLHSHSLRWIPGCLPPGTFVLQIVVGRALLTVTRSSGIPNHKCPNPHSSSPSSSLCCLLPRS